MFKINSYMHTHNNIHLKSYLEYADVLYDKHIASVTIIILCASELNIEKDTFSLCCLLPASYSMLNEKNNMEFCTPVGRASDSMMAPT